jgi:hypothetical protein
MPTPALAPETLTLAQQAQAFITNEACLIGPDTSSRTKPFLFYVRHNGCLVHKRFYMTFKWDGDTDFCYVITPDSSLEEGVRQIVKLSPIGRINILHINILQNKASSIVVISRSGMAPNVDAFT